MNFMNMAKTCFAGGLVAACALGANHASAFVLMPDYDATNDFSTVANGGSNVWSYGWSSLGGSSYAMVKFDTPAWSMSNYNSLGTPAIWKNTGIGTSFGVAPGQISLHPGPSGGGDFAILRFTAPTAATYSVTGQFFAGDSGNMNGSIVLGGNMVTGTLQSFASTTDTSYFAPLTLSMQAGHTLDFVVGNNGSFYSGNTPVSVQIFAAPVPEPETFAMLLAGLGVLGFAVRRRRVA